jgi:REP element-mobilizing transposase RayT
MTYLITFSCYGCHLHGDSLGSVDRFHNLLGSRPIEEDLQRLRREFKKMDQPPYGMDRPRRDAVLRALRERCRQRQWMLLAAHVRTSHVHMVVQSEATPERILNDIKSYASRCLNQMGLDETDRKRWARHGSTLWLWTSENVSAAIRYVVDGQGNALAVFEAVET